MRRWWLVGMGVVVGVVLTVAVGSAVWAVSSHPGTLVDRNGGGGRAVLAHTVAGQPYSVAAFGLCMHGGGVATVESVRPVRATGRLSVDAFAVRPRPDGSTTGPLRGSRGTLTALDPGFTPGYAQVVTGRCPAGSGPVAGGRGMFQVELQYHRAGWEPAADTGVRIGYRVDGGALRHVTLGEGVLLCPGTSTVTGCTAG